MRFGSLERGSRFGSDNNGPRVFIDNKIMNPDLSPPMVESGGLDKRTILKKLEAKKSKTCGGSLVMQIA